MTRRPRRGRGEGERSLAQRPLPLAPPPETWGRFDFNTAAALRFPAPLGLPIAPLPRNRLASSATGGASPVSPTPPKRLKGKGLRPLPFADAQRKWRRQTPRKHAGPGFPIRNRPGSAERSGERGKRSRGLTMTTHESRTYAIKCGAAVLCSTGVRRTRQVTAPLGGTVSPAPRPRST